MSILKHVKSFAKIHVDDCISGEKSKQEAFKLAEDLETCLSRGGFSLKGIAVSGEDPPDTLSDDGITVRVGGMKWYTKDDLISLNLGDLSFNKKQKGKGASQETVGEIPDKLTKRHCTSKVHGIFTGWKGCTLSCCYEA